MESEYTLQPAEPKRYMFVAAALLCVAMPGLAALKAASILLVGTYTLATSRLRVRSVLWFLSVLLNVAFWSMVGLVNRVRPQDMISHASRFLLFFLVLATGASLVRSGGLSRKTIDRLVLAIALLSVFLKIAILLLIARGTLTLEAAEATLGFETVSSEIGFGLQRLQFPSDIAIVLLIACYYGGRGKLVDLLFLVATAVNVFLSFSRYFFVAYAVCILLRGFRVRRLDAVSSSAIIVTGIILGVFSAALSSRFVSHDTSVSDGARVQQISHLAEAIDEHPLIGTGIGSSVPSYTRSATIPYAYEVQWYALTMQLGYVGLAWLMVNLVAPLILCLEQPGSRLVFVGVFLLWVAGGFTNPLVISLGSAFGLSLLVLTIARDREIASGETWSPHLSGG